MTGILSFGTSADTVVLLAHELAEHVEQAGKVVGTFGATAAYDLYIGVSFIMGATFAGDLHLQGFQFGVVAVV